MPKSHTFEGFYMGQDKLNILAIYSIEQDFIQKFLPSMKW